MVKSSDRYALQPAIRQPSVIPYLIRGPRAERFLEDYNKRVDKRYSKNKNLRVLSLGNINEVPTILGSNPFVLPVVGQLVAPARRVGRPEDLQATLNDGDTLGIIGHYYVDLGVALDFSGSNNEIAIDLFNQLPKRLRDVRNLPGVIVDYGLKNFDKGDYGLGLVFDKKTQLRRFPLLSGPNGKFSDKDVSLQTGLVTRLGEGKRILYNASQNEPAVENLGVSGFCLGRLADLGASDGRLAGSDEDGRVVLF